MTVLSSRGVENNDIGAYVYRIRVRILTDKIMVKESAGTNRVFMV